MADYISKTATLIFCLLLINVVTYAQQNTVSGTVTDSSGHALPGVNIKVKGTTTGTTTGGKGHYQLSVASLRDTLIFSYIGYRTRTIPIKGRTGIDITLRTQTIAGQQMVVVGYGKEQKQNVTVSEASVSSKRLQQTPSTNIAQSLLGKVSGVDITETSGEPGGKPTVRIRGITSITGSNSPLYVLDGTILPGGMPNIDPSEIKSVQVLKDASATAIYGSRGANGVVLITTKQGGSKNGKGKVSYNSYVSLGKLQHELSVLNSKQFLKVQQIAYQNAKKYDPTGWANGAYESPAQKAQEAPRLFNADGKPKYNTDWQKAATHNAITTNQHIAFSNGNANDNYRMSLGYHDGNGLLKYTWLKRYNSRFTIHTRINNWLTTGGFIEYDLQKNRTNSGWASRQLYGSIPISPVKFPNGQWAGNMFYPGMEGGPNLVQFLKQNIEKHKNEQAIINYHVKINLYKGLNFKSSFGATTNNNLYNYYGGKDLPYNSKGVSGRASISQSKNTDWNSENQFTYTKDVKNNHIKALAAVSWEVDKTFNSGVTATGFNTDFFKFNNIGAASNPLPPYSGRNSYSLNSFFGRINYAFKQKYLLTINGRYDGSSKFGSARKYGFFPSVSVGWRISNEKFMRNISFISNLKLRASYGITGSSAISPYQAQGSLGGYTYIFNNQIAKGVGISSLANPNLKWEKNKQADIGLDLNLFNNRFTLTADVYHRKSTNMLLNAPVPTSSGYSTVAQNIGSMRNQGFELNLSSTNIETKRFSWQTDFNITMNRNKVLKLTNGNADIVTPPTIIRVGYPVNSYYGYIRLGTWNTDQAKQAAQYGKLPGDLRYKDINGDGKINAADRVILGNDQNGGYGTLTNTFNYKNVSLTLALQYVIGRDIYNMTVTHEDRVGIANSLTTVLNAWTPQHQNTPIEQLRPERAGYGTVFPYADSRGIHNGSFLRGKNLRLAYNFPDRIINNLTIDNLEIYISAQNFFLLEDPILKKIIYDPTSVSTDVNLNGGVNSFKQGTTTYNGQYPKPETFTFGINVGF